MRTSGGAAEADHVVHSAVWLIAYAVVGVSAPTGAGDVVGAGHRLADHFELWIIPVGGAIS